MHVCTDRGAEIDLYSQEPLCHVFAKTGNLVLVAQLVVRRWEYRHSIAAPRDI